MTTDERIAALAAAAPPLNPEQRARLAALFRAGEHVERVKPRAS